MHVLYVHNVFLRVYWTKAETRAFIGCFLILISDPHLLDVIISELLENLTEDLIFERLSLQRPFKDLIGELVDRTRPFGRVVAHILHHRYSQSQGHQPLTQQQAGVFVFGTDRLIGRYRKYYMTENTNYIQFKQDKNRQKHEKSDKNLSFLNL